jgi:hypothetical protein
MNSKLLYIIRNIYRTRLDVLLRFEFIFILYLLFPSFNFMFT